MRAVSEVIEINHDTKLLLKEEATPHDLLNELTSEEVNLEKFEIAMPSLAEIFIKVVSEGEA